MEHGIDSQRHGTCRSFRNRADKHAASGNVGDNEVSHEDAAGRSCMDCADIRFDLRSIL